MSREPFYIHDTNLSSAWVRAFLAATKPGVDEISPLVVTITGFADSQPLETNAIRQVLDDALVKNGKYSCETVASTIFPQSLWNPQESRGQLFERYERILPSLKKMEPYNKYGIYFERLIAFGSGRAKDARNGNPKVNQLEHIIRTYRGGNHRCSALQASIFDPLIDHTNQPRRGFPCMQQVAFARCGNRELAVTGFYAMQYLFERAYGNYVGLCNLGRFIAHELDFRLTQMTCVAGVAKIGGISKRDARDLADHFEHIEKST